MKKFIVKEELIKNNFNLKKYLHFSFQILKNRLFCIKFKMETTEENFTNQNEGEKYVIDGQNQGAGSNTTFQMAGNEQIQGENYKGKFIIFILT